MKDVPSSPALQLDSILGAPAGLRILRSPPEMNNNYKAERTARHGEARHGAARGDLQVPFHLPIYPA